MLRSIERFIEAVIENTDISENSPTTDFIVGINLPNYEAPFQIFFSTWLLSSLAYSQRSRIRFQRNFHRTQNEPWALPPPLVAWEVDCGTPTLFVVKCGPVSVEKSQCYLQCCLFEHKLINACASLDAISAAIGLDFIGGCNSPISL